MRIKNTSNHYGLVSIFLHWFMSLLIIGMLILGFYMASLPKGSLQTFLIGWHKQLGVLVLILALVRLLWRLTNTVPKLDIPSWEKFSALTVHWSFYSLMLAMPLSGWLMTSAAGYKVVFFGLFSLPSPIGPNETAKFIFFSMHVYFAYLLIALTVLHTLATIKHHFIDRDDILKRIIS